MAICMKNLLGLVCDPIAAPIEVPCIKRNAVGVANAYISSDMALVGGLACTKTAVCTRKKLTQ